MHPCSLKATLSRYTEWFLFLWIVGVGLGVVFHFGPSHIKKHLDLLATQDTELIALNNAVVDTVRCLRQQKAHSYRPVGALVDEAPLYQRLVEAAWPIEPDLDSTLIAVLKSEQRNLFPNLKILCEEGKIYVGSP